MASTVRLYKAGGQAGNGMKTLIRFAADQKPRWTLWIGSRLFEKGEHAAREYGVYFKIRGWSRCLERWYMVKQCYWEWSKEQYTGEWPCTKSVSRSTMRADSY